MFSFFLRLIEQMPNVQVYLVVDSLHRDFVIVAYICFSDFIKLVSHDHHVFTNHQPCNCLFNSLFRLTSKETSKAPIMQKVFLCHDITMCMIPEISPDTGSPKRECHITSFFISQHWLWSWFSQYNACQCKEPGHQHVDGLMQERCNSIANALELHLSCTNPSM